MAQKISRQDAEQRLDQEFDAAFELLQSLVDFQQLEQMFPVRENAVYTTALVLWMLVYQRISPDSSLEAAVKKMIDAKPAFLPRNKRVVENTLSSGTAAYSRARSRLPREAAKELATQVCQSIVSATPPSFEGRRLFLIDGTTITLAPEEELRREFPPASNQHGESVWPVALLAMAHELSSGAALLPELGAMYGPQAVSETSLIDGLLGQMPSDAVVMTDAGFGIFAVAHTIACSHRDFMLRLTANRFRALRRRATLVAKEGNWTTWSLRWTPSAKERQTHPHLPADAALEVRLHEITINPELTLYLVTGLPHSATALADLYELRTNIEVDIRNFKVVLAAENIRARSVEMFYKELLMSVVSYNLVVQFRRQAAALAGEPPRRMSFKRTWTTYRQFLLTAMYTDAQSWRDRYRQALRYAMQDKLPHRPGRRYEREAYPRRPKSNQFKKRTIPPPKEPPI
jgi:hypothetical protein